jgi:hypothetical protein
MSHGDSDPSERAQQRPSDNHVSSSTSTFPVASGSGTRPDEGTNPTILTHSGLDPLGTNVGGIRSYVAEINRLVDSFRIGEKSRFEIISSITQLLNADVELSPQERALSFELYMAEITSIPETPRNKGKLEGRVEQSTTNVTTGGLGVKNDVGVQVELEGERDDPNHFISKTQIYFLTFGTTLSYLVLLYGIWCYFTIFGATCT